MVRGVERNELSGCFAGKAMREERIPARRFRWEVETRGQKSAMRRGKSDRLTLGDHGASARRQHIPYRCYHAAPFKAAKRGEALDVFNGSTSLLQRGLSRRIRIRVRLGAGSELPR